jgi:hypothetical protein
MVLKTPKEKSSIFVSAENWQARAARTHSVQHYDRLLNRRSLFTSSGLHIGLTALAILGLPLIDWPAYTTLQPMNIEIIVESKQDKLDSKPNLKFDEHASIQDAERNFLADATKSRAIETRQKNLNALNPHDSLTATPSPKKSKKITRDQTLDDISSTTPRLRSSAAAKVLKTIKPSITSSLSKETTPSFETASGSKTNDRTQLIPNNPDSPIDQARLKKTAQNFRKFISPKEAPNPSAQKQHPPRHIPFSPGNGVKQSATISPPSTNKSTGAKSKQKGMNKPNPKLQHNVLSDLEIARLSDVVARPSKFQTQAPSSFEEMSAAERYKIKTIVRRTIEPCWQLTSRSNFARTKDIQLEVMLDLNGTVDTARITNINQLRSSPISLAVAKSALRAILNPACQPFKLPTDKYQSWKNLKLTFNPQDIFTR